LGEVVDRTLWKGKISGHFREVVAGDESWHRVTWGAENGPYRIAVDL
jgi:hypothetical protein